MAHWVDDQSKMLGRIVSVARSKAVLRDASGGLIEALIPAGLASRPRKGQVWEVEPLAHHAYVLSRAVEMVRAVASTRWLLALPMGIHGHEDFAVALASSLGFDGIVLDVAADRHCCFRSSAAEDAGIEFIGDVLSRIMPFARRSGIDVYGRIRHGAFPDALSQSRYVSGEMPDIEVEPVPWNAPSTASIVAQMVADMASAIGVKGAFIDIGYAGKDADYSQSIIDRFYAEHGEHPPIPPEFDYSSGGFWHWQQYRESLWSAYRAAFDGIGLDICFIEPSMHRIIEDDAVGRIETGISGSFKAGFMVPASSGESGLLCSCAMGGDAAFIEASTPQQFENACDIVSWYGIRLAVFDAHDALLAMTKAERDVVRSSLDALRERASTDMRVGIVLSEDSRDAAYGYDSPAPSGGINGIGYHAAICRQIASLGTLRPLLFVDAVSDAGIEHGLTDRRCLVLVGTQVLSDAAESALASAVAREDKGIVTVGATGIYSDRTLVSRSSSALFDEIGIEGITLGLSASQYQVIIEDDAPWVGGFVGADVLRYGQHGGLAAVAAWKNRSLAILPDLFIGDEVDSIVRDAAIGSACRCEVPR